jgi:hypothetical protein
VRPRLILTALVFLGLAGPGCVEEPPPAVLPPPPPPPIERTDEVHLTEMRQLTSGGDNTGGRWSWDGRQILVQTRGEHGCARVGRVTLDDPPEHKVVAQGEGPAFLPGNREVVYASASPCPRRAERGELVLDPGLDIVRAKLDGSDAKRLTQTPGYDAEASVCGKDGSIVFTSMRDGDPDLYRMDADGGSLKRLTATAGYDGGATFDADCTHVAWQASRPKGRDLDEYKKQLAEGVLRPKTLELWIANADGTDARQITYLDARSWAPAWYPGEARILFSSSYGGNTPRDSDLWAIDLDGTGLERVSAAPGPDGSPAFSADGKWVVFSSARAPRGGQTGTNAFVARWTGASRHVEERPADHLMGDAAWLADRAREGRGLGTQGLEAAGAYVERSFKSFGLLPAGNDEMRQDFDVTTRVSAAATLDVAGTPVPPAAVRALGFSTSLAVEGPMVFVGADGDYARIDVKSKIVVVRGSPSARHAAWLAREHGAVGFVVLSETALAEPTPESEAGIVAASVSRDAIAPILAVLVRGQHPLARLAVTLAPESTSAFNVVARWAASAPVDQRLPGTIVLGAHYDALGAASPGADDNASGTAALLHVARSLAEEKPALRRDLIFVAFSGEEQGAAGARAFVKHPPGGLLTRDFIAMIDLDMVGRMRDGSLQVFGADSAAQWPDLLSGACNAALVDCVRATGGGLGGDDQAPFYEAGVPVLQLFTGVHSDHHKATDTADKLNATGMAQVARIAEHLARDVSDLGGRLDFQRGAEPPGEGEARTYGASLGTIPDRAGPPKGQKGMLLWGVRAGGPADKAGLKGGDIIVRLDGHVVGAVEDVMFVLTQSKPGAHVKVVVIRDGQEVSADVTLEAPSKR